MSAVAAKAPDGPSAPADRFGNAVPFAPYTDQTLGSWHDRIAGDITFMLTLQGCDTVMMHSVFGSGERLPLAEAAWIARDLMAARNARVIGNDAVYGAAWGRAG